MSNDQESGLAEVTIGNDGCPVMMDRLSTSPSSLIESPRPVVGHKRVNSFVATLKGAFFDDFCFEDSPDYVTSFKKVIIDGRDVLALRSEDIEKMSKAFPAAFRRQSAEEGVSGPPDVEAALLQHQLLLLPLLRRTFSSPLLTRRCPTTRCRGTRPRLRRTAR